LDAITHPRTDQYRELQRGERGTRMEWPIVN